MSDLATVYAEVCAKRPECAYEGLYPPATRDSFWTSDGKGYACPAELTETDAQALIEARWTIRMVKMGYSLHPTLNGQFVFIHHMESDNPSDPKFTQPTVWHAAAARILT